MSSFAIKIIASIAMIIDHIGYVFFPSNIILRIIGRLSMPLFAFQIAIGFHHTTNRDKYIKRMLVFAIVSQIPFCLMTSVHSNIFKLNIGFSFLLALLVLYSLEEVKPIWGKILCLLPLTYLACILNYDYYLFGIALVILFYYTYKKPLFTIPLLCCIAIMYSIYRKNPLTPFSIMSIVPILLYNGKKGKELKWFFYIFYPLHMLIFYLVFQLCL